MSKNNSRIKKLLESKSYSLIISSFTGKQTDDHELSMYLLLQVVYNNLEIFDLTVRYLILEQDNLSSNHIKLIDSYIKSKSYIDYLFMHKYVLKTPEFVMKELFQIQNLNDNTFRIKYEEKNFIVIYQLNNFLNNSKHTKIILLLKLFITDMVEDYELNLLNLYLNKTNKVEIYEKVIFYEHQKLYLVVLEKFLDCIIEQKNISYLNDIHKNNIVKYNYSEWENKYFGGNINNYCKN